MASGDRGELAERRHAGVLVEPLDHALQLLVRRDGDRAWPRIGQHLAQRGFHDERGRGLPAPQLAQQGHRARQRLSRQPDRVRRCAAGAAQALERGLLHGEREEEAVARAEAVAMLDARRLRITAGSSQTSGMPAASLT